MYFQPEVVAVSQSVEPSPSKRRKGTGQCAEQLMQEAISVMKEPPPVIGSDDSFHHFGMLVAAELRGMDASRAQEKKRLIMHTLYCNDDQQQQQQQYQPPYQQQQYQQQPYQQQYSGWYGGST